MGSPTTIAEREQLDILDVYQQQLRDQLAGQDISRPEHWGGELHMGLKGLIDQFDALTALARPDLTVRNESSMAEIQEGIHRELNALRKQLDEMEAISSQLAGAGWHSREHLLRFGCLLTGMRRVSGACLEFVKRLSAPSDPG